MFRKAALVLLIVLPAAAQRTQKPPLHGTHWMAVTGKPLAATAGAMMFQKGGNAVDAAAAMIAATCTMWDTLSWGGETQALIYNPHTRKVIGINALGVAPTGATADFFKSKNMKHPPEYGPLAAVTPGTPGGIMTMIAEYGKLSLKDDLGPAIEMADGYPIEAQLVNTIEREKNRIKEWPYSSALFLTNLQPGDVYKLNVWTQGPAMLEALNILEGSDLRAMGYNSARYINTVYQAMSLAFADRDFYFGDTYASPEEPVLGILSKEFARDRAKLINPAHNDPAIQPGDPYPFQRTTNPFLDLLKKFPSTATVPRPSTD